MRWFRKRRDYIEQNTLTDSALRRLEASTTEEDREESLRQILSTEPGAVELFLRVMVQAANTRPGTPTSDGVIGQAADVTRRLFTPRELVKICDESFADPTDPAVVSAARQFADGFLTRVDGSKKSTALPVSPIGYL